MHMHRIISTATHHVGAVLETVTGLLLFNGAVNFDAQHPPYAPLIGHGRLEEATP